MQMCSQIFPHNGINYLVGERDSRQTETRDSLIRLGLTLKISLRLVSGEGTEVDS